MRRLGLVAAISAVVLVGMLPGSVAAAPVLTFGSEFGGLTLRSNCIGGHGLANKPIRVVWKGAKGKVKANVNLATNGNGDWGHCSAARRLAVGDTIRATSGPNARTFKMPNITLTSNRVTERFSGVGLPGRTGQLWFHAGIFADYFENEPVKANSAGNWSYPEGASGGIEASVDWTTAKGDLLRAALIVPYVDVTIGNSTVSGGGTAFSDVTVNLRDASTNALRGRALATVDDWGSFSGNFRNSAGRKVNVRVGDRVVSNAATNMNWHVPAITGSANPATDFVFGNCGSTEIEAAFAVVRVYRTGHSRGLARASLEPNGDFSVDFGEPEDFFYDPANIKHGDRIVIHCYYDTYDIVRLPFRVP